MARSLRMAARFAGPLDAESVGRDPPVLAVDVQFPPALVDESVVVAAKQGGVVAAA